MKKSLITVFSAATLIGMTACGSDNATSDDGMNVEEILNESISAMQSVDSYSMNMNMSQEMSDGEEAMAIDMSSEASFTVDPMTLMQTTKIDMGDLGMGGEHEAMETVSYFTKEDGFFTENPMMEGWLKLPESAMEDMLAMSEAQVNPEEQLEPLMDYVNELSVESSDDSHVITLSGDGLDMEDLLAQMEGLGLEGMDPMMGEMMEDIDIEAFAYDITIDKETFYQTESTVEMTMNIDMMGQTMSIDQTIHTIFSEFNEIDPIEIPQEILDNAEEASEEDMMGGGF
ncbi:DUF6612 family protein [Salipaludibacillus sp. HK11]|uniref:DUF6612 family protein n=1 Tax=Salipaludibacillus sp. HK11 TaxID=3394320 RepID=UPI0039FC1AA4